MATTSARALRLLSLIGTGETLSGRDLAERLGVSGRTVRRDIDMLRELGYAIEPVKGTGGGYRIGAGGALPPLVLDEDQAVAIAVSLQATSAVLRGIEESGRRALATVRQVLPRRLRADADAFTFTAVPNLWEFPADPIDAGLVREVGSAVRRRLVVRLVYQDGAGEPAALRVEPHHLVVWAARWYLAAHDPAADRWRVLRLDRVRDARTTNVPFADRPLPPGGAVGLVKRTADRGDRAADWPCTGSAVLRLPAATAAEFVPGGAVVDAVSAHACRVVMGAWSWAGLAGLFITFGAEMTDVEPAELRRAFATVRGRLERIPLGDGAR
jgi:predicted DNA-binding transcriptional regulator YafY